MLMDLVTALTHSRIRAHPFLGPPQLPCRSAAAAAGPKNTEPRADSRLPAPGGGVAIGLYFPARIRELRAGASAPCRSFGSIGRARIAASQPSGARRMMAWIVHERRPRRAGPDEAISTHSRSVSWARHPVPESSGAAGSVDDQALTRDEHEPGGPRVFVFPYFYDHLPVRRVLRPVFTFLRSSVLLLVKTAAGPV